MSQFVMITLAILYLFFTVLLATQVEPSFKNYIIVILHPITLFFIVLDKKNQTKKEDKAFLLKYLILFWLWILIGICSII